MSECEKRIKEIENEIGTAIRKRDALNRYINKLKEEKDELQANYNLKKSLDVDENWSKPNYPWSQDIQNTLETKFNFSQFRQQQLAAINATLSKKDVLIVMPTGGGKTLCYQLPALINKGMTLVVSPLLALMEDQLIALRKLNIDAMSMSSGTSKEVKNSGFQYMTKGIGKEIKLMYVTPEWLAKSKKFMSALQKLHEAKKLDRIAIDEVHCCSQWGHDFRPDYKYLGLLKGMFPDIPILGLTATATTNVLLDIQNMLDIPGCAIIRAPFDRPNLKFKVVPKPDKAVDCYDYLEILLKKKFKKQSGIIYTATIKDCEEVTKGLLARGLNVKNYHAELPEDRRIKTHNRWLENDIDVIVATVAFGMGIDKAGVRFVIHFSVPKSMEALYQECGRAGRDGENAQCIVMYKLADYLKNSGYARSKTEIKNALSVLQYCLDISKCRHYLIGLHFEETEIRNCVKMCDNCKKTRNIANFDAQLACADIHKIMSASLTSETNLTLNKLVELWLKPKLNIKKPNIPKDIAEDVIGNLIIKNYIREEKSYTPYSVNCYLRSKGVVNGPIEMCLISHSSLKNYMQIITKSVKPEAEECIIIDDEASSSKITESLKREGEECAVSSSKKLKSVK